MLTRFEIYYSYPDRSGRLRYYLNHVVALGACADARDNAVHFFRGNYAKGARLIRIQPCYSRGNAISVNASNKTVSREEAFGFPKTWPEMRAQVEIITDVYGQA